MNEIEKMYKNAGIIRRRKCEFYEECPLSFGHSCDNCDIEFTEVNSSYPSFTAEKQLKLIKRLSQHTYRNYIKFRFDICGLWYCECNMLNSDMHHTFEDALAQIINNLWQDLTEKEKEALRGILRA